MQETAVPFGRYLLVERFAEGVPGGIVAAAFRAVARAGDIERTVLLKQLRADALDDGWRERARALGALLHLNLAALVDHGVADGVPFVAVELVEGVDLGTLGELALRAGRPLAPALGAWIVAEAARGLLHLHARSERGRPLGLLHRNVAPRNVLVGADGEVKLTDFALARSMEWPLLRLRYASPEQLAGEPLDGRSDVYALAAVLYEALAGQPLVTAEDEEAARRQIAEAAWAAPSAHNVAVPVALDEVVLRALARDRDARPDAAAFARMLGEFLAEHATEIGRDALAPLLRGVLPPRRDAAARPDEAELYEEGSEPAAARQAPRASVEARGRATPAPAVRAAKRRAQARRPGAVVAVTACALALFGVIAAAVAWRARGDAPAGASPPAVDAAKSPAPSAPDCALVHLEGTAAMHRRLVAEAVDAALCATPPGHAEALFPADLEGGLAAHGLLADARAAARATLAGAPPAPVAGYVEEVVREQGRAWRAPGVAVAALASLAHPDDAERAIDLLRQQGTLGRWRDATAPDVGGAGGAGDDRLARLCERGAAVAHLGRVAPESVLVPALTRWLAARPPSGERDAGVLRYRLIRSTYDRPGQILDLVVRMKNAGTAPQEVDLRALRLVGVAAPPLVAPEHTTVPPGAWREVTLHFANIDAPVADAAVLDLGTGELAAHSELLR